jgi:hypothetical protein
MELLMNNTKANLAKRRARSLALATSVLATALGVSAASAANENGAAPSPVINRTIGYVLTNDHWAIYTSATASADALARKDSDGKSECPQGFNLGPREQYAALFPNDGTKRTVADTELKREAAIWFPTLEPDKFAFKESQSKVAEGLNLDGKVGPNDYVSPEGETGIKNQLNRALGCVEAFRPSNTLYDLNNRYGQQHNYTRLLLELTNVDSLVNDDDVTVTFYHGRDPMVTDGTGNEYLPYGTGRTDERPLSTKMFTRSVHGKITNGVLTTDPIDYLYIAQQYNFDTWDYVLIRGARLKLRVLPDQANGLLGGYLDINSFHREQNGTLNATSIAFGRQSSISLYKELYKLADGYPDSTGRNMAISAAKEWTFKQIFIKHCGVQFGPCSSNQSDALRNHPAKDKKVASRGN